MTARRPAARNHELYRQPEIPTTPSRVDQPSYISKDEQDHLIGMGGPMNRARTRKMNEALTQLLIDIHKENQSKSPEPSTRPVHILVWKLESIPPDARVPYPDYSTKSTTPTA